MTAEEILAKAADRVEKGWCQGNYMDGKGGVCVEMALGMPNIHINEEGTNRVHAIEAMRKEVGRVFLHIWNDEAGRTKEEVATTLRNAKRWL